MKDNFSLIQKPDLFPRASTYDPEWILQNQMGPNGLWLTEWLASGPLHLRPDMKVLDLACGTAMTSIFLAKEYGVQVWAVDKRVPANENTQRIATAGLGNRVTAIQTDATSLPFDADFFDVAICIDAFEYFGTNVAYIKYLSTFVKHGGRIGIVNAGLRHEFHGDIPDYLQPYWHDEFNNFHSDVWWKQLWQQSGVLSVDVSDTMPNSSRLWLDWETFMAKRLPKDATEDQLLAFNLLKADAGRNLVFNRTIGTIKHH